MLQKVPLHAVLTFKFYYHFYAILVCFLLCFYIIPFKISCGLYKLQYWNVFETVFQKRLGIHLIDMTECYAWYMRSQWFSCELSHSVSSASAQFSSVIQSCPTLCDPTSCSFLKRQVRWSGSPISFRIFHCLLRSTQSKALA